MRHRRASFALLLLLVFFIQGCGDTDKYFTSNGNNGRDPSPVPTVTVTVTPTPTPSPTVTPTPQPSATVRVIHVLARAVGAAVDAFRFTAFDAAGEVVYGPVPRDKMATIDLTGVPVTAVRMQIEYFEDEKLVGIGSTPMALEADELFVISDPFFFDVTAPLTSLEILPAAASIPDGTAQQFTATATFADNSEANVTSLVTWSSTEPSVATISNDPATTGRALAESAGSTTIRASLLGVGEQASLTVTTASLQALVVEGEDPSIPIDGETQFTATATFSDGSMVDVTEQATWSSSAEAVATVDNDPNERGEVTGEGPGNATISAFFNDQTASAVIVVTTASLQSISINPDNALSSPGSTRQYRAIGSFSDGTTQDLTTEVTWSVFPEPMLGSSNAVAVISNSQFGPLAKGEAQVLGAVGESTTIRATLGAFTDDSTLTVGLFVYTANSGTISAFVSNPTTGALTVIGTPLAAPGVQFICMHPSGRFVYAVTGFGAAPGRVIYVYAINPTTGELTAITGSPFSFPERVSGSGGSFSGAAMHPSGRFLYALDTRGTVDPGFLRLFTLAEDGTPTESGFPGNNLGTQPLALAIHPDGDYLYLTDDVSIDSQATDLSGFRIDQQFGNVTEIPTSAWRTDLDLALDLEVDPTGRFVYVIENGDNEIQAFRVGASGILVQLGGPVATGNRPNNVHVHPSGRFVYVSCGTDAGADSLSTYQVGVDGSLTIYESGLATGNFPRDLVTTPLGNILYVCNEFAASVGTWTVPANGDINFVDNTASGIGPYSITTTP